ncbi:anaphase-promoting complex subunit 11 RING-H2 finger-domain-containing protein, partial [Lanmaoa asiatica]
MKVHIKHWSAVAQWRWNIGNNDPDDEGDVCGICRVPYEGCCPSCKMPGDDCPLIWGECSHIFHMHCLLKWLGTAASKQQCPMDRRPWGTWFCCFPRVSVDGVVNPTVTAERKVSDADADADDDSSQAD